MANEPAYAQPNRNIATDPEALFTFGVKSID